MQEAELILDNGRRFLGNAPLWQDGAFSGEVVFTTGMTGYTEALTDPSFAGQILVFTYPLIGNYGVPGPSFWESSKIHLKGVVIGNHSPSYSHAQAICSLTDWLAQQKVPLLTQVDTRALTKELRQQGTMFGAIICQRACCETFEKPSLKDIVKQVTTPKKEQLSNGLKRIIAIDCGIKENILRAFKNFPVAIVRVPYDYDYTQEEFDGIFISNGPGDPMDCQETVRILRKGLAFKKPVFGICLGAQLLALAAGGKTFKLPFGHRGQNQPCIELKTKRCFITSQNHGYAIDPSSLTDDWEITFKNLNDDSVEGIAHKSLPFAAVQFHPEASPGPTDTVWLFQEFIKQIGVHV